MKAAIYARKSTDDNDRNKDNKSVTRQIERALAYAEARGWTVDEDHVFVDDGISGADFTTRKGLLQMLTRLKEFDYVIMSELSRLGREQSQTSKVLADIYANGVRVFFYLTDEELNYESAVDKFLVNAIAFAAEMEREKASQRSRDALERKARKGYNTGGVVYGYDNVPIYATSARGEQVKNHTEYRINEEQADVIRRIFTMYADGHGLTTIAKTLNGDPRYADKSRKYFDGMTPASPRKGTGSWAPSSLRAILHNPRYEGKIPFGRHRKVYQQGKKKRIRQDEYELIDAPELRIVPADLVKAVRERQDAVAKTYIRDNNGNLWGRPGMGRESRYLLTGLGRCACCGSNIAAFGGKVGSPGNRKTRHYYGCSYHHNRGLTVCENNHRERLEALDAAVLDVIERQVLTPEAVTYTVEKAFEIIEQRLKEDPDRPKRIEGELAKLRKELARFMNLIADGKAPDSVLEQISDRENRIKALEAELQQLQSEAPSELDMRRIRKGLRERISRFRDLIRTDIPVARQALRKLLAEPLVFSPVVVDGRKTLKFEGKTSAGVLIDSGDIEVASPRGFEPLLPP